MKKLMIIGLLALAACGTTTTKEAAPTAEQSKAVEASQRIRAMEDSMYGGTGAFDKRKVQALYDVYKAYAKTFPLDTLSPRYLMDAARLCKELGNAEEGVTLYDRVIHDYPNFKDLPACYMNKALLFDDVMDQKGRAKQAYEDLIAKYPDHPFAKDARVLITQLDMTPDQWLQMAKMKEDSANAAQAKK